MPVKKLNSRGETEEKSSGEPTLYGWQQEIINLIDGHETLRDSEQYQGVSEYNTNKELGVTVCLPRSSGHTFLSNYIAHKYPTMLVYGNMPHYREVTGYFPLHPGSDTISVYELFYAAYKPSKHQVSSELLEFKKKLDGKKAIVIDNGMSLQQDLSDLIYNSSNCIVVKLGH